MSVAVASPVVVEGRAAHAAARAPVATGAAVVRQAHPEGCGAALLATLLDRNGLRGSEAELLERADQRALRFGRPGHQQVAYGGAPLQLFFGNSATASARVCICSVSTRFLGQPNETTA